MSKNINRKKMIPEKIFRKLENHIVPLLFVFLSLLAIPLSGYSLNYLLGELLIRLSRNSVLVLSLLIPIMAGMGLNFGMTLGAMAGEIGLIFIANSGIIGLKGLFLAMLVSTPISLLLGFFCGKILNRAKGREMVTSFILAFFMNGVYQLVVLYSMGGLIPIKNEALLLSRGYGIRNAVNLIGIRQVLDNVIPLKIGGISIPLGTYLLIAVACFLVYLFQKTKLSQDMRAVAQSLPLSESAGIQGEKTRLTAIIISTVMAGYGMIIFLQNVGTMNTYNSHEQIGMFSIAALLVGGASVTRAKISHVFLGIFLLHLMFIVSPTAGKNLIGSAQLGEFFRVFISYGVICAALVLYSLRRKGDRRKENGAGSRPPGGKTTESGDRPAGDPK